MVPITAAFLLVHEASYPIAVLYVPVDRDGDSVCILEETHGCFRFSRKIRGTTRLRGDTWTQIDPLIDRLLSSATFLHVFEDGRLSTLL